MYHYPVETPIFAIGEQSTNFGRILRQRIVGLKCDFNITGIARLFPFKALRISINIQKVILSPSLTMAINFSIYVKWSPCCVYLNSQKDLELNYQLENKIQGQFGKQRAKGWEVAIGVRSQKGK